MILIRFQPQKPELEQQSLPAEAEEIIEEQPLQEKPVAWRRGPKKKAVEETQQIQPEPTQPDNIAEEQPLQEEPVAWRRGPKKQPTEEKPKPEVEPEPAQTEEIIEEQPLVEEPVAWRRGPKKQLTETEEGEKQSRKGKQKPKPQPKEEVEKVELKPIPRKKPEKAMVTEQPELKQVETEEVPEEQPIETKDVTLPKVGKAQIKAPKFLKKLQPKMCKPDEPTELRATIDGVPFPEIKWFLNDAELHATQNFEMNVEEKVVTLKIAKVTPELIGTYTCQVKNEAGVAISRTNIALGKCQTDRTLLIYVPCVFISYRVFLRN